jgi:hypothetical protein
LFLRLKPPASWLNPFELKALADVRNCSSAVQVGFGTNDLLNHAQHMEFAVKSILGAVSLALLMGLSLPAAAAKFTDLTILAAASTDADMTIQVAEGDEYAISEGQAADIALATQPEAKVIKVKLLPSGVYAVTLKEGGNVTRVMVDANSGAIM